MFQNSYQNGTYFQLFDPKLSQDKTKNLYKLQNISANYKIFDKNLKTFIYEFVNVNAKITFPREDKKQLYLIQQFLNIQVQFGNGDWHIQLTVSDLTKTKRRIILSPAVHKIQKKPFFVKYPCPHPKQGVWMNLCIDLYSFIQAFKGQTYRSLDSIQITGNIKLRRIFTTHHALTNDQNQMQVHQNILLPKNLLFPTQIQNEKYYVYYQEHDQMQHTECNTSKNISNMPSTKNIKRQVLYKNQKKQQKQQKIKIQKSQSKVTQFSIQSKEIIQKQKQQKQKKQEKIVKTQKIFKDQKKFLANTNGLECYKSKKDINKIDQGQQTCKSIITPMSTGKNIKKKREPLAKTHIPKEKQANKNSIQKKIINTKDKSIAKTKIKQTQKLNPWRNSSNKKNQTGRHQSEKIVNERKIQSAQATLFKTNNNITDKSDNCKDRGFQRNSSKTHDSDYFQLSQKFSTVTEGRLFKHIAFSRNDQHDQVQKQTHDQIQQNIEIETSSHYSNSKPNSANKDKENIFVADLNQKAIEQSINDSLDQFSNNNKKNQNKQNQQQRLSQNQSYFNTSSRFGFGQKMMNKFMKQIQRPYSPPLGERQHIDQNQTSVKEFNTNNQTKGVQMLYDPVLNCYYDHKTHTYYELKN